MGLGEVHIFFFPLPLFWQNICCPFEPAMKINTTHAGLYLQCGHSSSIVFTAAFRVFTVSGTRALSAYTTCERVWRLGNRATRPLGGSRALCHYKCHARLALKPSPTPNSKRYTRHCNFAIRNLTSLYHPDISQWAHLHGEGSLECIHPKGFHERRRGFYSVVEVQRVCSHSLSQSPQPSLKAEASVDSLNQHASTGALFASFRGQVWPCLSVYTETTALFDGPVGQWTLGALRTAVVHSNRHGVHFGHKNVPRLGPGDWKDGTRSCDRHGGVGAYGSQRSRGGHSCHVIPGLFSVFPRA